MFELLHGLGLCVSMGLCAGFYGSHSRIHAYGTQQAARGSIGFTSFLLAVVTRMSSA